MAGKRKKYTKDFLKKRNIIIATSLVMILFFSIVIGVSGLHKEPVQKKIPVFPDYSKITVKAPVVKEKLLTQNVNSRPGIALKKVNGVVIHYTANPGTDAMANRNYFESRKKRKDSKENKVSSNYIIGLDGTIIRCVPDTEIAYASNQRNADSLSIECCHPDKSGKFSTATYQSLIHLVAYLCDRYEISLSQIIRHYDITGKNCPKYYVENENAWKQLKQDIVSYLKRSMNNKNTKDTM